ncbi:MAG TPA: ABC transporter permease [Alphaproteobacteria bacterium]|nr:ABC transporter permease [Alphaproteobacteria bacterium]
MTRYVFRRLCYGVVTIWLVTLFVFGMLRLSGDPIKFMLPPEASFSDIERMRRIHGLDKPLWYQYLLFNKSIFTGEFGISLRWDQRPAFDVFRERLPATVQLATAAVLFSVLVGVPIGVLSATRPDSLLDRLGRAFAITGQSMPVFWVGLLLILLFTVQLGWLPSAGGIDRLGLKGIIMPAVSLGFYLVAAHMRIVRSTMLDALNSDYIKMVQAKGMPKRITIWKHALKNAAIPVFTLFAVNFAQLISGAVITESIFAWPGIGRLLVESVFARDYTVVQTVVFFSSAIIVVINLVVDLSYAWLDPRIRLS